MRQRDLLAAEVDTRGSLQIAGQTFSIHDYSELLHDMQTCVGQQPQDLMVFICQVDVSYSAAFALFKAKLMASARVPGWTRLRVLTMSESEQYEESLMDALTHLAPNIAEYHQVSLLNRTAPLVSPREKIWGSTNFIQSTVNHLKICMERDAATVVHCSPDEAKSSQLELDTMSTSYRAIDYSMLDARAFFKQIEERSRLPQCGLLVVFLFNTRKCHSTFPD